MFCIYLVSRYLINYICIDLSSINIYLLLIINKMQPTEFCEYVADFVYWYEGTRGFDQTKCKGSHEGRYRNTR